MQNPTDHDGSEWLTPAQASIVLGVTVRTLSRWADRGQITVRRLPSGHRRFQRSDVVALAEGEAA